MLHKLSSTNLREIYRENDQLKKEYDTIIYSTHTYKKNQTICIYCKKTMTKQKSINGHNLFPMWICRLFILYWVWWSHHANSNESIEQDNFLKRNLAALVVSWSNGVLTKEKDTMWIYFVSNCIPAATLSIWRIVCSLGLFSSS